MKDLTAHKKGFTLVELMVVIAIVSVLTIMGATQYTTYLKRGRDVKRKADLEQIRTALEMYRADNGSYPVSASWVDVSTLALSSYLSSTPQDPQQAADPNFRYRYYATSNSGGVYYGYCVSIGFEIASASDGCTTNSPVPSIETIGGRQFNYRVRNP